MLELYVSALTYATPTNFSKDTRMMKIMVKRVSTLLRESFDKKTILDGFVSVNRAAWPPPVPERYLWTEEKVRAQIQNCPHLLFCAFARDVIIGTLSMIHVDAQIARKTTSWEEISGFGTLSTHRVDGDCAFGLDLSVDPSTRDIRAGDRLIRAGLLISAIHANKKGVFLGSRVPRFHKWANKMSIEDYVYGKNGRTRDPEIRLYQSEGFKIVRIIPSYMEDPESLDFGVLMFYQNPLYRLK